MTNKNSTKSLRSVGQDVLLSLFTTGGGHARYEDWKCILETEHSEVLQTEREKILENGLREIWRSLVKAANAQVLEVITAEQGSAPNQGVLPGFEPTMGLIVVDEDGKYEAVGFYKATWADWENHLSILKQNRSRVDERIRDCEQKMDVLKTAGMHESPSMRTYDAMIIIGSGKKIQAM